MPRLALLCGMICSGKSTYAQQLKKQWNAVVLSWDRLTLSFFPEQLGEEHDRILEATDDYLLEMAEQILAAGSSVILDCGFWNRKKREAVLARFSKLGYRPELHYVKVSPALWQQQVEQRNALYREKDKTFYYVDENMRRLFPDLFQPPEEKQVDVLIDRDAGTVIPLKNEKY